MYIPEYPGTKNSVNKRTRQCSTSILYLTIT